MARLIRLWFLIVALALQVGCSSIQPSNKTSLPSNMVTEQLFAIYVRGGGGTAFPIGFNKLATASHMVMDEADGGVDVRSANGQVCWGEFSFASIDDERHAVILTKDVIFVNAYEVAAPRIGWAWIRTPRREYRVWLLTSKVFIGFTPIPGESGSPVVQDGKAVGVLTHRCPQGGLYRGLKE